MIVVKVDFDSALAIVAASIVVQVRTNRIIVASRSIAGTID